MRLQPDATEWESANVRFWLLADVAVHPRSTSALAPKADIDLTGQRKWRDPPVQVLGKLHIVPDRD